MLALMSEADKQYLLALDLKKVANSLSRLILKQKLTHRTLLLGVHAFLMALHAAGHVDSDELAAELHEMADYFHNPAVEIKN